MQVTIQVEKLKQIFYIKSEQTIDKMAFLLFFNRKKKQN